MNLRDYEFGIYAKLMTDLNLSLKEQVKVSIVPATKYTYLTKSNSYFEIFKKKFIKENADTRYDLKVSVSNKGYMVIQLLIPKKYSESVTEEIIKERLLKLADKYRGVYFSRKGQLEKFQKLLLEKLESKDFLDILYEEMKEEELNYQIRILENVVNRFAKRLIL